ncbi:MAG: hypothetical protein RLZZ417_2551 [Bacteroidota bacterium]|jgi:hypothetical protein
MDLEEKYQQLKNDLNPFSSIMNKATDTLLDEGISKYPIFVVSQLDIELGIPLVQRSQSQYKWSLNLSTLEELATKKIVQMERIDHFRSIFKDPDAFFCLFTLSDLGAQFIFLPRD